MAGAALVRVLSAGAGAGLTAGLTVAAVEAAANWIAGGSASVTAYASLLAGYGLAGLVSGAMMAALWAGACATRGRGLTGSAGLASGVAVLLVVGGYGVLTIYNPAGLTREALQVALALLLAAGAGWRLGPGDPSPLTSSAVMALLTSLAVISGRFAFVRFGLDDARWADVLFLVLAPMLAVAFGRRLLRLSAARGARAPAISLAALGGMVVVAGACLALDPRLQPLQRSEAGAPGEGPNVLLVSLDTTRADRLSVYGYERESTPHIAELANDALVFTQCYANSGWTLPTHASIFTGMYSSRHGAHFAGTGRQAADGERGRGAPVAFPLQEQYTTLAEVLRAAGYRTGAVVGNSGWLYRRWGLAQGFDYYDDAPRFVWIVRPPIIDVVRALFPDYLLKSTRSATEVTAAASAWLDERPGVPFFLFVNYMDPHQPWPVPSTIDEALRPEVAGYIGTQADPLATRWLRPDERLYRSVQYEAAIRAADRSFGRLLEDLRRRGLYDRTLIVVVADHGELLGEHQVVGHRGTTLYEELLHVPLIIKYPGQHRRGRVTDRVQLVDLMPTVLAELDLPVPRGVQGQPLPAVRHEIVAEQYPNPSLRHVEGERFQRTRWALYDRRFKYILSSDGRHALYDLDRDPDESHNLYSALPERAAEYAERLERWLEESRAVAADGRRQSPGGERTAHVHASGYLD